MRKGRGALNKDVKFWRFHVDKGPLTLRELLKERIPLSGRGIKRLLDRGWVFLNEERVFKAGVKVLPGDEVEAFLYDYRIDYEILYEDDYFIAVYKPPFVLTNESSDSLESILNRDGYKVRAIHRLDAESSGILLFAKGDEVFEVFKALFRNKRIEKIYKVIAEGRIERDHFKVNHPIDGKEALTLFKVLKRSDLATLLEAKLITGRKHQIRIHLLKEGYPVVGDKLYRRGRIKEEVLRRVPRTMIHCERMSFKHPFDKVRNVEIFSSLPEDFVMVLKWLF